MKHKTRLTKHFFKVADDLVINPTFLSLSSTAQQILIFSMQFFYDDNPDHTFTLPYSQIQDLYKHNRTTISKALKELINAKYIIQISSGGRNKPATYNHNHKLLSVFI